MEHISLDLWAANLEVAVPDLATWLGRVETRMASAAARGCQLLVMPEFACAQWLSFAPHDLAVAGQLAWLSAVGQDALASMKRLSVAYGVSLVPGTIPEGCVAADGTAGHRNRAWLLTPDDRAYYQDKLSLTPLEENGAAGVTIAGDAINVIDWNGIRLVIAICLDAEFTALWSTLGELDVDLIIVPAKTDMITGYNRVFGCARARAIELQTVVCAVGAVGVPLGSPLTDTGVGGASVFLPCDVSVSLDGVMAALLPQPAAAYTDPILSVSHIPVGLCRRIRNGSAEAEVCPALWNADHLKVGRSVH